MAKIKLNDIQKGRNDGMAYALKIIEDASEQGADPVETLREEVRRRAAQRLDAPILAQEAEHFMKQTRREAREDALRICYEVSGIVMAMALRDELGFGAKRIRRVLNRYFMKMYCIDPNGPAPVTITDYARVLKAETKIDLFQECEEQISLAKDDKDAATYRRMQLYDYPYES